MLPTTQFVKECGPNGPMPGGFFYKSPPPPPKTNCKKYKGPPRLKLLHHEIYEKGSELIRMLHLLGPLFMAGWRCMCSGHDGRAPRRPLLRHGKRRHAGAENENRNPFALISALPPL